MFPFSFKILKSLFEACINEQSKQRFLLKRTNGYMSFLEVERSVKCATSQYDLLLFVSLYSDCIFLSSLTPKHMAQFNTVIPSVFVWSPIVEQYVSFSFRSLLHFTFLLVYSRNATDFKLKFTITTPEKVKTEFNTALSERVNEAYSVCLIMILFFFENN